MKTLLLFLSITLFPFVADAAPATYSLLSPLGTLTGAVTLTDYLQGIMQVTIGVAGILAVIMMVICGIQMMGSPSVSQKSASKECITNALFGLILALASWIILATINTDLLRSDANIASIGTPTPVGPGVTPTGTYEWSTVLGTCPPVIGQIVSTVPSSYCTGTPGVAGAPCCGYVTNPLPLPIATPVPPPAPGIPPPAPPSAYLQFTRSLYPVKENAGAVQITILRSVGTSGGSVDYALQEIGGLQATQDVDYTNISGTLVFAPGELTKSFLIPIINDTAIEMQEYFRVKLTNPTGAIQLPVSPFITQVEINDNDFALPIIFPDFTFPNIVINSPPTNTATTLSTVNVNFSASDNVKIYSINITYAPPDPQIGNLIEYCFVSCPDSITTTYVVPINNAIVGNHKIQISVCDTSANCSNAEVIITIQGECTSCVQLPIGKNPSFPLCETNQANTPGKSGIAVGLGTKSYEFMLTSSSGGGNLYFAGGFENEYPPPARYSQRQCLPNICASEPMNPSCQCIYGMYEYYDESGNPYGDCITYQPPNLAISISDLEEDLSSTPNTVAGAIGKTVSGNCGTAGTGPQSTWTTRISNIEGPGVCRVELNRKYYVNVSTYPFVPVKGIDPIEYSMFWDYAPF